MIYIYWAVLLPEDRRLQCRHILKVKNTSAQRNLKVSHWHILKVDSIDTYSSSSEEKETRLKSQSPPVPLTQSCCIITFLFWVQSLPKWQVFDLICPLQLSSGSPECNWQFHFTHIEEGLSKKLGIRLLIRWLLSSLLSKSSRLCSRPFINNHFMQWNSTWRDSGHSGESKFEMTAYLTKKVISLILIVLTQCSVDFREFQTAPVITFCHAYYDWTQTRRLACLHSTQRDATQQNL